MGKTGTGMEILDITESNGDTVLKMMREFYESDAVATNGSDEIFGRDITQCIERSPYLSGYVFVEAGEVAGYGMIARSWSTEYGVPCIWFEDIYVRPEYRSRGAGRAFVRYIAEQNPGCLLRMEVTEDNEGALRMYLSEGFTEMGYIELKKWDHSS